MIPMTIQRTRTKRSRTTLMMMMTSPPQRNLKSQSPPHDDRASVDAAVGRVPVDRPERVVAVAADGAVLPVMRSPKNPKPPLWGRGHHMSPQTTLTKKRRMSVTGRRESATPKPSSL